MDEGIRGEDRQVKENMQAVMSEDRKGETKEKKRRERKEQRDRKVRGEGYKSKRNETSQVIRKKKNI